MKMKLICLILVSVNILFANSLIVKDGDVTLLINGQKIKLSKDHNLTLEAGTMVCFIEGNGKVIINNKKHLDNKTADCYQIPVKDDFNIKKFLSSTKNKVMVSSIDSNEKNATSTSRGAPSDGTVLYYSIADDETSGEISISSSDKEFIVYGETYGPLPVTLSIKKSDGSMVKEIINEDNSKTFFRVPTDYLENNSKIEVTNAFGDKLLNQQVTIDSTSKPEEKHNKVYYEKENHTIVDILYGTDRKTKSNEKWENYYSGERGKLKFGVAEVSIPKKHKLGEMERPVKWWFYEQKEKIGEHVIIRSLKDLPKKIY